MHLLLLNNNPAVSRLIKLSVDKVGYALDEFEDYGLVPLKHYDLIMVDNECCDEEELATLCDNASCQYVLYIAQRGVQKPDFANALLEKPFLPTDFLSLLEKIKNVLASLKTEALHEEIDLSEEEPNANEEEHGSFDIDAIDTFGIEDEEVVASETGESHSFEELSLEDDEPAEEIDMLDTPVEPFGADDTQESQLLELPTFDLDAAEENDELELPFISEHEEISQEPLEEAEERDGDFMAEEVLSEKEAFNEPTILDKDDINEVKQLLDDDENDTPFSFEEDKQESRSEEAVSENEGVLEEVLSEEETPLAFEDVPEELSFDLETPHEENEVAAILPTHDEIIDDFEEVIEEHIEEERLEPTVDVSMDAIALPVKNDFDSLDDLNENAIKRAFGEEVEEEAADETVFKTEKTHDVEVIRGEIESSIAHSLSTLAQSDILREALKGMRINISITFDEKN